MKKNVLKRILLCVLVLSIFLSLTSCKKDIEPIVSDEPINTEPSVTEVKVSDDVTIELIGDFLEEYDDIEGLDVRKFMGTAIVNVRPPEYQYTDIPVITMDDPDYDLVFNLMHLSSSVVADYAISVSESRTRAYTVAIIRANLGYEEFLVNSYLQRVEDLGILMKDYPDQMYLVEHYILKQLGSFLVLVICDNAEQVYIELEKAMTGNDLTKIESVPLMTDEERKQIEDDVLKKELDDLYAANPIESVVVTPVEDISNVSESPNIDVVDDSNMVVNDPNSMESDYSPVVEIPVTNDDLEPVTTENISELPVDSENLENMN